jgi:preprotein translocase subunit YajC
MEVGDSWALFAAAIATGREMTAEDLVSGIHGELERIGDVDLTVKVNDAVQKAKTQRSVLSQYFNNLKQRPAKEEN